MQIWAILTTYRPAGPSGPQGPIGLPGGKFIWSVLLCLPLTQHSTRTTRTKWTAWSKRSARTGWTSGTNWSGGNQWSFRRTPIFPCWQIHLTNFSFRPQACKDPQEYIIILSLYRLMLTTAKPQGASGIPGVQGPTGVCCSYLRPLIYSNSGSATRTERSILLISKLLDEH